MWLQFWGGFVCFHPTYYALLEKDGDLELRRMLIMKFLEGVMQ